MTQQSPEHGPGKSALPAKPSAPDVRGTGPTALDVAAMSDEVVRLRQHLVDLEAAFVETVREEDQDSLVSKLLARAASICDANKGLALLNTGGGAPRDLFVAGMWPPAWANSNVCREHIGKAVPEGSQLLRTAVTLPKGLVDNSHPDYDRSSADPLLASLGVLDHHLIVAPIIAGSVSHGVVLLFRDPHRPPFPAEAAKAPFLLSTLVGTLRLFRQSFGQFVKALASAIDKRDTYTAGHSGRVSRMAGLVATELGMPTAEVEMIRWAGYLHDIGKIGLCDDVLAGEGDLSNAQFAEMKTHPGQARAILESVKQLNDVMLSAYHHHENYNGGGYPDGIRLDGKDRYQLWSAILRVVDSYDAMTSDRSYRKGRPSRIAIQEIEEGRGELYDPAVVDAFLRVAIQHCDAVVFDHDREKRSTLAALLARWWDDADRQRVLNTVAKYVAQVHDSPRPPTLGVLVIDLAFAWGGRWPWLQKYLRVCAAEIIREGMQVGEDWWLKDERVICLLVSGRSPKDLSMSVERMKAAIKEALDNGFGMAPKRLRIRLSAECSDSDRPEPSDAVAAFLLEADELLGDADHSVKPALSVNCGLATCQPSDTAVNRPAEDVARELLEGSLAALEAARVCRPPDRANCTAQTILYSLTGAMRTSVR